MSEKPTNDKLNPKFLIRDQKNSMLQILLLWIFVAALFVIALKTESWLAQIFSFLLIGVFQYRMNVLGHDGLHGSLFKNRRVNDQVSRFFLHGPCFSPFSSLKKNHFHHHRYVGDDSDNDQQYYSRKGKETAGRLKAWLLGSLFGAMFFPIVLKFLKRGREKKTTNKTLDSDFIWDLCSVALTQLLLLGFFISQGHVLYYFIFWMLPFMTMATGLNSIRSTLEHIDLAEQKIPHAYSFRPSYFEAFILSPFKMCYHWEHHLFPSVPYVHLPGLASELKEKKEEYTIYSSYLKKI